MNTLRSFLTRNLARFAAAAALAFSLCSPAAKAVDIKMETKVPGYTGRGSGWVLVLPELRSVLGGAVRWDSARGCYITDRVARGETMRITLAPTTPSERFWRLALTGIAPGEQWYFDQLVLLPYVNANFRVSTNPAYDNVFINVFTTSTPTPVSKRIPIGSR